MMEIEGAELGGGEDIEPLDEEAANVAEVG